MPPFPEIATNNNEPSKGQEIKKFISLKNSVWCDKNGKNVYADKMSELRANRSIFGETNVQMSRLEGGQWTNGRIKKAHTQGNEIRHM